jgi:NtrC-family two-component system sensor histidine kinase KinB
MSPISSSYHLPPLRRSIFRHSLAMIALYSLVGVFMMMAVFLASGVTPKLIHLNYDSILAARQMTSAWQGLLHPEDHPEIAPDPLKSQFDQAIFFAEHNITEPGEGQITGTIRTAWNFARGSLPRIDHHLAHQMTDNLEQLVLVNEKGMFKLASDSNSFSTRIFIESSLLFILSLLIGLYLADSLAVRISAPLKDLAEILRGRAVPGKKLKLPEPRSLEMRILTHELSTLWERLSELQKLNLEEISSQGKKLEAVLSSVDDAILVLDNQEQVIHCNPVMVKFIGLNLAQIMGQFWRDLSSMSESYLKLRELLQPTLTHSQVIELDVALKSRVFSGRCRPFFAENGERTGLLYLLHDITEVRQKDRLKAEFIGVLSHELKTPLQSLGTASEILFERKENMPEEERTLIETVHEDVERIRAVANEFVQVGLVDLHSLKLKMELVPISGVIQQWIQPFRILTRDKNVELKYIKEGSDTIYAQMDAVKFYWAISNLISNAVRMSPPHTQVVVHLTDREGRVDLEVRDEGPGVTAEIQKKMFDPYFQGEKASSGFLGLGLTITKEVVEAHDGRIDYFARSPHGCIFRISLPLPSWPLLQ